MYIINGFKISLELFSICVSFKIYHFLQLRKANSDDIIPCQPLQLNEVEI